MSVAGTISWVDNGHLVHGTNSTLLTLSEYTGDIQWQVFSGISWVDITGATANTYTVTDLTETTYFRAKVTDGANPSAYTDQVELIVDRVSVAGTISGEPLVHLQYNNNVTNLSLSGYEGNIQWQKSTDISGSYFDISGAISNSYQAANLTVSTYFRVAVKSGVNPTVYSSSVYLIVDPASIAGVITGAPLSMLPYENNNTTLDLSGSYGAVQWQSSVNDTTYTNISDAVSSNLILTNLTAPLTYYRAMLTSGVNDPVYTSAVLITVGDPAIAGIIDVSGSGLSLRYSNNSNTLTVSGYTGDSLQWQESYDGTIYSDINAATSTTYSTNNLIASVYYRVKVINSGSAPVYTTAVLLTVYPLPVAGTINGFPVVHQKYENNSITLTYQSNTDDTIQWQSTADLSNAFVDISGETMNSLELINLKSSMYYRVKLTNGPNDPVYTASGQIIVDALPIAGSISGVPSQHQIYINNSNILTLSSSYGFVNWEYSETDLSGFAPLFVNNTTYTATNLTTTTIYRVVVTNGVNDPVYSDPVTITVDPQTVAGTISGEPANLLVYENNSTLLTLIGYTGNAFQWQSSLDNATWSAISGAIGTSYTAINLPVTTYIRVRVKSGVNDYDYTASVTLAVGGEPAHFTGAPIGSLAFGNNTFTLTLTHYGTDIQWQSATEDVSGSYADIVGETGTSLTVNDLTVSTYYRVKYNEDTGPEVTESVFVSVAPLPVAGTISGEPLTHLMYENNDTTLTLIGSDGSIQWQSSTNGMMWPAIDGETSNTLRIQNLTVTKRYRAVVSRYPNPPAYTSVVYLTVDPQSVAGTITGAPSTHLGYGNNYTTLQLAGYNGSVQWQLSSDISGSYSDIVGETKYFINVRNLVTTTYYRAIVTSGVNDPVYTSVVALIVDGQSIAGIISGEPLVELLYNNNDTTLTLSGQSIGDIKWQQSANNSTWTDISGATTDTLNITNLTAETTYYRVAVKNGASPTAYTSSVMLTVTPASNGGIISPATPHIMYGTGTVVLSVSGEVGVLEWQSSTDGTTFYEILGETGKTLTVSGLYEDTYYRTKATSGGNPHAHSEPVKVIVDPLSVAPDLIGVPTSHIAYNDSVTLDISGTYVGALQWQTSSDNATWSNIIGATAESYTATNLTEENTYLRVKATSGVSNPAYSSTAHIIVDPLSVAGDISGGNITGLVHANNSTTLELVGYTGTIQWQTSLDDSTWADIDGATSAVYVANNLGNTTYFRAVVTSGVNSPATSASVSLAIDPPSEAGMIYGVPETHLRYNDNDTTLTTSGFTGSTQWQESEDNMAYEDISGATTSSLQVTNLIATTYYRVKAINGGNPPDYSDVAELIVDPLSVAGDISGSTTHVGYGTNSKLMTLVGNTGSTIKWQESADNSTFTDISGATSTTYTAIDLIITTYYRVVVTSGVNDPAISASFTVTVDTQSVAGSVTGTPNVNLGYGSNSTVLDISGYTGTTFQWQQSADNSAWSDINGATSASYTVLNITASTYYRAGVKNGESAMVYTAGVQLIVDPVSVAGSVAGAASGLVNGSNSTVLTVSGYTGTALQWQSSVDNATWSDISDATATTYTAVNLTTQTYYRVKVTNLNSPAVYTAAVILSVLAGEPTITTSSLSGSNLTLNWTHAAGDRTGYVATVTPYVRDYPLSAVASSPGCLVALEGDSLGTVGSSVTSWTNQVTGSAVGNFSYNATGYTSGYTAPTVAAGPMAGTKVVRFNDAVTTDAMIQNVSLSPALTEYTVMICARWYETPSGANSRIIQNVPTNLVWGWSSSMINTYEGPSGGVYRPIAPYETVSNTNTNTIISSGLLYTVYNGYFNDNVNFFDNNTTYRTGGAGSYTGTVSNISAINVGTNNYVPGPNSWSTYSVQWVGFFKPDVTGTWTFWTNSDDASYLWIGPTATSGYTTGNCIINNGGLHPMVERSGTANLIANTYYPIRIQFGQNGGGDNMIVNFQGPAGSAASSRRTDGTNFYFNSNQPISLIKDSLKFRIYTLRVSSSSFNMSIGGIDLTKLTSSSDTITRLSLGGNVGTNQQPSKSEVAGLFVWNRHITDFERLSYESQLARKYGVLSTVWNNYSADKDYRPVPISASLSASSTSAVFAVGSSFTNGVASVYAVNGAGNGDPDSAYLENVNGTIATYAVPDKPTNVTASFNGSTALVTWTAPVDTGGSTIIDYNVTSRASGYATRQTTSSVFKPSAISGLFLWLDAADATTLTYSSGTLVSQWNDKSGNNRHFAQATVSNQPVLTVGAINGVNALRFGSESSLRNLTMNFNINAAYTIFAIGKVNQDQGGHSCLLKAGTVNNTLLFLGRLGKNFATFTGTATGWNDINANSPASETFLPSIMCMTVNGSVLTPYFNGTAMTTKTGTTASFTGMILGMQADTQPWIGDIAEVIIYGGALSTSDRQKIEGYLAWKWGLTAYLPTGHPYKT